ncbi:MAG: GNAT family N-acetyltransferase [Methanotrichaceae archaeon]
MCILPPNNLESSISIRHELRPGDVGYITYLHGTIYAEEEGFDSTFDAYVAIPLSGFSKSHSHRERIWIVEKDGKIVGSVAIVKFSESEAQLRWLLLDRSIRGIGLGRRLVDEALKFSLDAGYSYVFLWTVKGLTAATSLYESFGFRRTQEETHEIWGGVITEVRYELKLQDKTD